jgi:predicted transcriptional regulator of viral defense system
VRLKRNLYVLNENWENFDREDLLRMANFLQIPSYISFMTALSVYEVTTQVQRDFLESASLKRSIKADIKGVIFKYYKLKKQYYFGFVKKDNIFIATKEKAFVDAVYLYSFGKYKFDLESLDLDKLDEVKLKEILKAFPQKTKTIVKKLCRI